MNNIKIILGSGSTSRQHILKEMGYDFTIMPANIDEKAIRFENPRELVEALGNAKADALIPRIKDRDVILITGDQVVVHDGKIREKPESVEQAKDFLKSYSNSSASTVTSVCVTDLRNNQRTCKVDTASVYFKAIPNNIIEKSITLLDR